MSRRVLLAAVTLMVIAGCTTVVPSEPATSAPTSTIAPFLAVDHPRPGDVFESSSVIRGTSSTPTIGFRLAAGDAVFTEGSMPTFDGAFSFPVEFVNTCCIEMELVVFHPGTGGMTAVIPLVFPENEPSA